MQSSAPSASRALRVVLVFEILALALWTGGLTVLGAIVAPTVFGIIPAPASADAMTVVFRRFDSVAMTCSVVALLCEAARARLGGRRASRLDLARGLAIVVAAGLAITEGVWLSPTIQALHVAGAVRGLGDAGLALERAHRLAETLAKIQLVALLLSLVLYSKGGSGDSDGVGTPVAEGPDAASR